MKKNLSLLLLFSFQQLCIAQDQHKIDSLQNELKKFEQNKKDVGSKAPPLFDSTKANILNGLCEEYWMNSPEKGMDCSMQALELSERIGYSKGIVNAYNSIGVNYFYKGDYDSAFENNSKALIIAEKINYRQGEALSILCIANVYWMRANYPEAMKNYYAALKINEEIGDKKYIAACYNAIGILCEKQGNYPEALKNYSATLKIMEEIDYKLGIAMAYGNIGMVYEEQSNYPEALKNFQLSLKINEELKNKAWISMAYLNIGNIYYRQGNYSEALKNNFASLKIAEEIGDKSGIASATINIGEAYEKQGKLSDAIKYITNGLILQKEIGALEWMKEGYDHLARIDSAMGNFKGAFENHKLYMQMNDSMFNMEKEKKLTALQMTYEFDKKQDSTKAEQVKKDAVALKELQKQKLVRNGFVGGFAVVLLFAGVFFRQRNKITKGKKRSDELLLNILPSEVAEELKAKGSADAKQFDEVTVMFTDFKNFTQISEKLSPTELVNEIHTCFKAFDNIITKHNIEKIKTIGDSYMCAGGLPVANKTNAVDVVSAAMEIQHFMQTHFEKRQNENKEPFEIRIGIHTGQVVAGIVGVKKFAYDIWGDTVNIASRMESSGEAGKVNISGATYELVKYKFMCIHRGKIRAKNKGEIDMYFVG